MVARMGPETQGPRGRAPYSIKQPTVSCKIRQVDNCRNHRWDASHWLTGRRCCRDSSGNLGLNGAQRELDDRAPPLDAPQLRVEQPGAYVDQLRAAKALMPAESQLGCASARTSAAVRSMSRPCARRCCAACRGHRRPAETRHVAWRACISSTSRPLPDHAVEAVANQEAQFQLAVAAAGGVHLVAHPGARAGTAARCHRTTGACGGSLRAASPELRGAPPPRRAR